MAFIKQLLPVCPRCGQPSMRVLETRKTPASLRRRKKCDSCNYMLTTHEISKEDFEKAKQNEITLSKVRNALEKIIPPSEVESYLCLKCKFNNGQQCEFDLPEYSTEDAFDCNLFKSTT
jgi:hypothetical protein